MRPLGALCLPMPCTVVQCRVIAVFAALFSLRSTSRKRVTEVLCQDNPSTYALTFRAL